jgi:hypothetical protein
MSPPKDIFSADWFSTVTAAQMCRVSPPPPDSNPIAVPRAIFDELVRIAEAAGRLKQLAHYPAEMVIHRREDGFAVTVFDPLTAPYTVTERTLLGAISEASSRLESMIDERPR